MIQTIVLLLASVLFFMAGCGFASWSFGSVILHTVPFGLFFLALSAKGIAAWPCRKVP